MTLLTLFTKNMAFEDSNQKPCDYPGIFFTHIMASMDVSSTTTLAQSPPASQLLVAVENGGASKHVAVVRPRFSGGVGQTAARKCHGVF